MEMNFCQSCAAPLIPEMAGVSEKYCKLCTKPDGTLQSREFVRNGIVQFMQMLEPGLTQNTVESRADYYMKAMPAWAEK